ncbi:MAG: DUF4129 domain-containing protein [Ilumatobacteraceae bacterium]
MDRRLLTAVAGATVAGVLLVLAASSGPGRLWVIPSSGTGLSSIDGAGPLNSVVSPNPVKSDRAGGLAGFGVLMQVLGVLVVVLAVAATVSMRHWWPALRYRPGLRKRAGFGFSPLPEVPEVELTVNIDAAGAALAVGNPRNAIVGCWIQLERDAAAAGLPRAAAETSAEFVERVVAAASVDVVPIGELAALYREARFSVHELRDDHRARALAALNRVAAALRRSVGVAT